METLDDDFPYRDCPKEDAFTADIGWISRYAIDQAWLFAGQYCTKLEVERLIDRKLNLILKKQKQEDDRKRLEHYASDRDFILRKMSKTNRQGLHRR